ncbi:helix-turn-helix domain-containing protein, partial [Pseudomonas aeruginosa]
MSIKAMNWAWEQPLSPVPKLVLMALADNADDHGYCWPKMKTIAVAVNPSRT